MCARWCRRLALLLLLAAPVTAGTALDLNAATKADLIGIGLSESQALQVISHREKNGAFLQVEELMAVPQMTKPTFEKIRTKITVDQ